ncbi:hypothetical protein DER45DRAFT_575957 [Fusarium avenaceum]|nr:hypothetical protein DER45DRAFT_575957 [Fusarium avenaceum]
MAAPLSEITQYLWRPPRKEPGSKSRALNRSDPENYKYYRNWGFNIYRTYYGEGSDKHWHTLLDALRRQTHLAVGFYDNREVMENDKYWKQGPYRNEARYMSHVKLFKELFRLFPREDPVLLDGLGIDGIREVCLKEHPDAKKNMEGARFCFALVADEAVLKGISQDKYFVKAVGYDWTDSDGGWGWDRLRTCQLLDLWEMLFVTDSEGRSKYYDMNHNGPEEELEKHVWLGDFALPFFGECSQVEYLKPRGTRSSIGS